MSSYNKYQDFKNIQKIPRCRLQRETHRSSNRKKGSIWKGFVDVIIEGLLSHSIALNQVVIVNLFDCNLLCNVCVCLLGSFQMAAILLFPQKNFFVFSLLFFKSWREMNLTLDAEKHFVSLWVFLCHRFCLLPFSLSLIHPDHWFKMKWQ